MESVDIDYKAELEKLSIDFRNFVRSADHRISCPNINWVKEEYDQKCIEVWRITKPFLNLTKAD
jgi:hypothetical protein